jgi:hypothetical protein
MGKPSLMSDMIEVINPRTKTCTLLQNGEVIATYKMEQCDKCSQLSKLDNFGYQKGYDYFDNVIWFCGVCR